MGKLVRRNGSINSTSFSASVSIVTRGWLFVAFFVLYCCRYHALCVVTAEIDVQKAF